MTTARPVRPAIVVGVDGSVSALHATRWAAMEAALHKLPLRLVHAYEPTAIAHPTTIGTQREYLPAHHDQGRHRLREAAAIARSTAPAIEIADVLRVGTPARALIEESAGAWLVVLGSGGVPGVRPGSVAVAVAEHGHGPVTVVRGAAEEAPPPTGGPVLVGVDGSPASEDAIALAFDAAAVRGVELVAVHCWSEVSFDGLWNVVPLAEDSHRVVEAERRLLEERLAGWQEKYPDVPVRRLVLRDRPVRALLKWARLVGAQLIVVGARGRCEDLTGVGMGSTSRALLRCGECPVTVVRPVVKGENR